MLICLLAATLVAALPGRARADELPRAINLRLVRSDGPSPRVLAHVTEPAEEVSHFEHAVWLLTMKAQRLETPYHGWLGVLPILASTTIGATVRMEY